MSFFEELKRRNVVKVAVLYVIASWLILQVADVLFPNLGAPDWAFGLVLGLLVLFFFPAVIFSWVYEMTPEGLKREKDVDRSRSVTHKTGHKINILIIVMLALAIATVVADRLMPETATPVAGTLPTDEEKATEPGDPSQLAAAKFAPAPDRSIAVLPFVNMSSDPEQEYFSDGLSEELLNLLAKVPELRVSARTSSFSFKGQNLEIPEIAERLQVAHVLEGSVRKSGNQVRITAQLIQADGGYHLWSETYDRKLDDVFVIQDEIASEVVEQLKVTLLGGAPKTVGTDPEAYALVLQARHLSRQNTPESMARAVDLYQKALAMAPDYVAAWAGLSDTYGQQAFSGVAPYDETFRLSREAVDRALAIDPDYAQAHAQLGMIANAVDVDVAAAARHYERALALAPTDTGIIRDAATQTRRLGRLDKSIAMLEYVTVRDPVDPAAHQALGLAYLWAGRFDDAIASYKTALTLSPGRLGTQYWIGLSLLLKGDPASALEAFSLEQSDEEYRVKGTALALHDLGREAESQTAFAELRERWGDRWPSEIAQVYAWTGDRDSAFKWLDKAVAQNEDGLNEQFPHRLYASLHSDPRWEAFRERTGTSEAQLAAIDFKVELPR
jgi:adenylate cyclase